MKNNNEQKAARKVFTRQFYLRNKMMFALALTSTFLAAFANLVISWLMQQIIDAISGVQSRFSILELTLICAAITLGLALMMLLEYHSVPRFVKKAMRQYKDFAFGEISKKASIPSTVKTPRLTFRRCPTTQTALKPTTFPEYSPSCSNSSCLQARLR